MLRSGKFWMAVGSIVVLFMLLFLLLSNKKISPIDEAGWLVATSTNGVVFNYPQNLPTTYMSALDWPPLANIVGVDFRCAEAGNETDRAGQTVLKTVNGRTYCVTQKSEGAAGSIYDQYAYAFIKDERMYILAFSTRAVQCANYPSPQKTECESERRDFNLDDLVDRIAQTVRSGSGD